LAGDLSLRGRGVCRRKPRLFLVVLVVVLVVVLDSVASLPPTLTPSLSHREREGA